MSYMENPLDVLETSGNTNTNFVLVYFMALWLHFVLLSCIHKNYI